MEILTSSIKPQKALQSIAELLEQNAIRFPEKEVFREQNEAGEYEGISWEDFYENILNISANLLDAGFGPGEKMVIFSRNCLRMLELELAIIASGGIAVPIFANFKQETASLLISHSDARWLAIQGNKQLVNLDPKLEINHIWAFEELDSHRFTNLSSFSELLKPRQNPEYEFPQTDPDAICLNMYTSGTMSTPKCVQLSQQNILSQQAALASIWNITEDDRFLSYLPWHHSFGGIFELFTALTNGASIALESSYGREPATIMKNWKEVHPTVFFSVPRIYQELYELTKLDREAEEAFFNSGLKFVFTAAAPLPQKLSDVFEEHGIAVIEGWGLTETSPCCTITDPARKREPGVVGMPLPGVSVRISDEDEIQVKGPNIMYGYYKNDEANRNIFTEDGWYRTGDVGEITASGLKLVGRKDRIFKLSNGEKVVPSDLEKLIESKCNYIAYALVAGSGRQYPVALLFPKKSLLQQPDYHLTPLDGCFCPRSIGELGKCLRGCLSDANESVKQKFTRIRAAAIIDEDLSIENGTLTPSLKVAPNNVLRTFKAQLESLYDETMPVDEEVYVIDLEPYLHAKP